MWQELAIRLTPSDCKFLLKLLLHRILVLVCATYGCVRVTEGQRFCFIVLGRYMPLASFFAFLTWINSSVKRDIHVLTILVVL